MWQPGRILMNWKWNAIYSWNRTIKYKRKKFLSGLSHRSVFQLQMKVAKSENSSDDGWIHVERKRKRNDDAIPVSTTFSTVEPKQHRTHSDFYRFQAQKSKVDSASPV